MGFGTKLQFEVPETIFPCLFFAPSLDFSIVVGILLNYCLALDEIKNGFYNNTFSLP